MVRTLQYTIKSTYSDRLPETSPEEDVSGPCPSSDPNHIYHHAHTLLKCVRPRILCYSTLGGLLGFLIFRSTSRATRVLHSTSNNCVRFPGCGLLDRQRRHHRVLIRNRISNIHRDRGLLQCRHLPARRELRQRRSARSIFGKPIIRLFLSSRASICSSLQWELTLHDTGPRQRVGGHVPGRDTIHC